MTFGFDYWGTITRYPELFKRMMIGLDSQHNSLYVISAVSRGTDKLMYAGKCELYLHNHGFPYNGFVVVQFDSPLEVPELKYAKAKELGIGMFFDDRQDVCKVLERRGIPSLWVTKAA